jgi:hypothetical protein
MDAQFGSGWQMVSLPFFWCQWWEDVMARSVSLRESSVYPRQPGATMLGEHAFTIPRETTTLPGGNDFT